MMIMLEIRGMNVGLIACVFLLILGMLSCPAGAVSIGISPAELDFENVLKGGYAEGTVAVSTSNEEPLDFLIWAEGQIGDWIEFEPSENLTFSRDQMRRITVIVRPPGNVANGVYTGSIMVSTKSAEPEGGDFGVGVTTGTASDVTVRVTGEEIKKASIQSMEVRDTEEGSPVEFSVSVMNEGNVIISPLIKIEISRKGQAGILKSISHSQTSVLPTKMSIIRVKIETDGLEIGEYSGKVQVFLGEEKLSEQVLAFSVLERGSLSKRGVLQKIWNEPWVNAGEVVKIDAYFENSGEVLFTGKFKGEIRKEGRLIEVVESEELEVPIGKTVVLSAYFKPESPGQYVMGGYVVYGGKTTETKESFINVNPAGAITPPRETDPLVLALAAGAAVIVIIFLIRKRLKRGKGL